MHFVEFKAAIQKHPPLAQRLHQLLPAFSLWLICSLQPGCSTGSKPPAPPHFRNSSATMQKAQFKLGARSAKADLARGVLAWETQDNGEWERHRILWCFRKILAEKYRIEYRIRGHFVPADNEARIAGYQSVMAPCLSAKFGADWRQRIYAEAEAFYRAHWHEVKCQYFIDEPGQPGYEDYVRQHPISEEERRTRNPFDKFYDYRDEDPRRQVPSARSTRGLSVWESIRVFFSSRS